MSSAFIRSDTSRRADIRYCCGSTGAGKSSYIKADVAADKRLLVFDPDDEYGDIPGIVSFHDGPALLAALKEHKTKPFKARLVQGGQAAFELCNSLAFAWTNCSYIAEEIADVTRVGKAPQHWGQLLRRGRKRAIKIYMTTQRPSEADKTALTQASIVRTGLLGRHADREALARDMDIPIALMEKLRPLDFIEAHRDAQRRVFVGNAADGTREEITARLRDNAPEAEPKPAQKAPVTAKKPANNSVKAPRRNAAQKAGTLKA
ncbi:hypothetical protein [Arsukibacterium sp.]|uniref:hypothetical protein n=1 Tax=Arsukibacterium sp. TaxID=1977258 RepID=UPI002FDB67CF